MIAATRVPCPSCGGLNPPERFSCDDCGAALRTARPERVIVHAHGPRYEPMRVTLKYLSYGALLAPVFTFTPLLRYMGWFLGSLCHETGHTAIAWFLGFPAFPAIRLDGHAVAIHGQQETWLCVVVWAALVATAWRFRSKGLGVVALLYPLFAFTGMREFFFLTGGHVGELVFATIFFWRALVGWSRTVPERVLYATCAWFLLGRNLWLCLGLLFSADVRNWYASSGSLGLRNDYVRLASEVMNVGLGAVALMMLVVSLSVLPAAWFLARGRRGTVQM